MNSEDHNDIPGLAERVAELERQIELLRRAVAGQAQPQRSDDGIVFSTRYADTCRNADGSQVRFMGRDFTFGSMQQQMLILALWRRMEAGGLGLEPHEARAAVVSDALDWRPARVFRNHPALGQIVHVGPGGSLRLGPPPTNPNGIPDSSRNGNVLSASSPRRRRRRRGRQELCR